MNIYRIRDWKQGREGAAAREAAGRKSQASARRRDSAAGGWLRPEQIAAFCQAASISECGEEGGEGRGGGSRREGGRDRWTDLRESLSKYIPVEKTSYFGMDATKTIMILQEGNPKTRKNLLVSAGTSVME